MEIETAENRGGIVKIESEIGADQSVTKSKNTGPGEWIFSGEREGTGPSAGKQFLVGDYGSRQHNQ